MISSFYNKHRHLSISPKGRAHDRPAMLERVGRGPFLRIVVYRPWRFELMTYIMLWVPVAKTERQGLTRIRMTI